MSHAKKTPTYNLKVVLQLTGIKPDTLRAWERRYGLPLPQRTAGGHRLYSQYDIEMIKWLMERQEEGMRINRAIDLFRSIETGGKDPLDDTHPVGRSEVKIEQPMVAWFSLDEIRNKWVEACLAYDEPRAEQILSQSFALYTIELVCLEVLQRGIVDIGERWYRGEATVQQEHFTSSLVTRRLDALIAASPAPTRPEKLVVGCPAQEEHVMAALMTTLFLRRHGWDVVYLGANVPLIDLERVVESTAARMVILIAHQLHTAANLYTAAQKLQGLGITVAFAGSIFIRHENLNRNIPGYYLGNHLDRVVQEVEVGLKIPASSLGTHVPRSDYRLAKIQIEDRQSMIKADIWNELHNNGINGQSLQIASDVLMQAILSALALDNLDCLRNELQWVKSLITNQVLPSALLPELLQAFARSIDRHTGDETKFVSGWLLEAANQQERR